MNEEKEFRVKNLRSLNTKQFTSDELKKAIIKKTKSVYDRKKVMPERTTKRPSNFEKLIDQFKDNFKIMRNIFIVSALGKYNRDLETRYLILIDGEVSDEEREIILSVFNNYVPIMIITTSNDINEDVEHSYLSEWFRKTMGNGFSFVDIDFLIYNYENGSVLLLEEKNTYKKVVGYGQLLSYEEMLEDVMVQNSILLMFLYSNNTALEYFIYDREKMSSKNRDEFFENNNPGFLIKSQYIGKLNSNNSLINYISKILSIV